MPYSRKFLLEQWISCAWSFRRYCYGNCCEVRKGGGDDDDRWRSLGTLNTAVFCRMSDSAGQKCALTLCRRVTNLQLCLWIAIPEVSSVKLGLAS